MNSIDIQRKQYILDAKSYRGLELLVAAYESIYERIPDEIQQAIKDKREEFKIEDENEI